MTRSSPGTPRRSTSRTARTTPSTPCSLLLHQHCRRRDRNSSPRLRDRTRPRDSSAPTARRSLERHSVIPDSEGAGVRDEAAPAEVRRSTAERVHPTSDTERLPETLLLRLRLAIRRGGSGGGFASRDGVEGGLRGDVASRVMHDLDVAVAARERKSAPPQDWKEEKSTHSPPRPRPRPLEAA